MELSISRRSLAWVLEEAERELEKRNPGVDLPVDAAGWYLLEALRAADLTVTGLGYVLRGNRWQPTTVEKIPWHFYDSADQLRAAAECDLVFADPSDDGCRSRSPTGGGYLSPTVACAEVRAWLDRSDEKAIGTPTAACGSRITHPGCPYCRTYVAPPCSGPGEPPDHARRSWRTTDPSRRKYQGSGPPVNHRRRVPGSPVRTASPERVHTADRRTGISRARLPQVNG
jgi:hypothetical protein